MQVTYLELVGTDLHVMSLCTVWAVTGAMAQVGGNKLYLPDISAVGMLYKWNCFRISSLYYNCIGSSIIILKFTNKSYR